MMRRWLIRALALALLTLGVVAWVGSYYYWPRIAFADKSWDRIFFVSGRLGLGHDRPSVEPFIGWHFDCPPKVVNDLWPDADATSTWHGFGFSWFYRQHNWYITFPLWFPTLLSTLLLWFVWRKTKAKYNGRGFPVEPTKETAKAK